MVLIVLKLLFSLLLTLLIVVLISLFKKNFKQNFIFLRALFKGGRRMSSLKAVKGRVILLKQKKNIYIRHDFINVILLDNIINMS